MQLKIAIIFPKDSEAIVNRQSNRTFGGATIQLYLIARELFSYNQIKTFSFIPAYKDISFPDIDRFHFVKTFNEKANIIRKIWIFHRRLKEVSPDVIIQRGLTLISCFLAVYCRIYNIKYVFMFAHDIESSGIYQRSRKKCYFFPMLLRFSHILVTQNEYEYNILSSRRIRNLEILKKGIDFELIEKSSEKKYDCAWIARCEKWKKPDVFLDLVRDCPDLRFLMICSEVDSDREFYRDIKYRASDIKNLEFLEFVEYKKIYKYLSLSRIFCITSEMEGDWPMTVLEAAASGMPILSLHLNYGNIFETFDGGYFCEGDYPVMLSSLRKLIEDEGLYRKKSSGAIGYMHENHSIQLNVRQLLEYISSS